MRRLAQLKRLVPRPVRTWLRPAYTRLQHATYRYLCPVCEHKVPKFVPLPAFYAEQFKLHGSDLRVDEGETCNWNAYSCPECGASDRDRLYALYISKRLNPDPGSSFRLLDIAPADALSRYIRATFRLSYRTADLNMQGVDDLVDLTHMDCYPDKSFDAFICSHVLEHIPDDRKAMSELYRILKPGGWGIAMVPINLRLTEIREDPSKVTEEERWRYFGQFDHVRFYTRSEFMNRLQQAGFRVLELGDTFFGTAVFTQCGIAQSSVLYVVEKSKAGKD